ncbi:unnamed protein product [Didymodactylos carnosus]|uniref:TRAF-type domain-containing protein n=1 Tax=Didymodactylos carnosus TaxID=1234261 RepID=A0A814RVU4_9BILA|nr:unnamed protein product [Didymodactylos carnosus]CAF1139643.1 unnamed protein product [Didymodactylos carnosus]CAF3836553.1 unnamed protein product [Didymodactylos carnosus]CAF3903336.1 unnamed protein product [Didymodactylos carnosus]
MSTTFINGRKICPFGGNYEEKLCPISLYSKLTKLEIKCRFEHAGCNQILSYESLDQHEQTCDYQSTSCKGCRKIFLKKAIDQHEQSCASIEMLCDICNSNYKQSKIVKHFGECVRNQLVEIHTQSTKTDNVIEDLRLTDEVLQYKIHDFDYELKECRKNVLNSTQFQRIEREIHGMKNAINQIQDKQNRITQTQLEIQILNSQMKRLEMFVQKLLFVSLFLLVFTILLCVMLGNYDTYNGLKRTFKMTFNGILSSLTENV